MGDKEATTDAEWSGAAAPGAAIELASCADTTTTDGHLIALENVVNAAKTPDAISLSFGICEASAGAARNAIYAAAYQQAVSEGISGGKPCTSPPSGWSGDGGTSYAAPIMAGIQALVDQHAGGRQGNPNPVYYRLAAEEYGRRGNPACNSSRGDKIAHDCIFHNVTSGDNDMPCAGSYDCYLRGGTYGVLSNTDDSYEPAFVAGPGWNFTTGLGSVDAANLVKSWPAGRSPPWYSRLN
jgi:subtilase family serine protease